MAQSLGLPVSRLINVAVNLSPTPAPFANFDTHLIIGSSNVINGVERLRVYETLLSVAGDFGTSAPEYLAAALFFGQTPRPQQLFIGRWLRNATSAENIGGPLTPTEQVLANWTAISNGSFTVVIDGSTVNVSALNFTGALNLNGVASIISAGLVGSNCIWNGEQFIITSASTGTGSSVSYVTGGGPGTDISARLKMTSATAELLVPGFASESALAAVLALDGLSTYWYFMDFAAPADIVDADYTAIAAYIEGAANPHIFGVTTSEPAALTLGDTTSIGHLLKESAYKRSTVQYSSTNPYAMTSLFARGCTVDFTGSNTAITFMWKQEPGVDPEFLGSTEADALDNNNYNYLAEFNNGISIIVNGKTASGFFIDEIWGTDWFANNIQVNLFNLLLDTPKIPQTDPGIQLLVNVVEASCVQAVNNGLLAPGVWNAGGFGTLKTGDTLSKGWYVFAPAVATQAPADRAQRKSPLIMVAAKLAGAIHSVDVLINVNQ